MSASDQYTIGQLAKAAGVGVETIRYYQRRGLLAVPDVSSGFRTYPFADAERIRFIKRAQELGFSLEEISHLLMLEDSNDKPAIRDIASERLDQVRAKLADLKKMETMLTQLIDACASAPQQAQCPIIKALGHSSDCHHTSGREPA